MLQRMAELVSGPLAPEPAVRSEVKSCSPAVGSHAKIQLSLGSKGHPPSKLHMPCIGSTHLTNSSSSSRQCHGCNNLHDMYHTCLAAHSDATDPMGGAGRGKCRARPGPARVPDSCL